MESTSTVASDGCSKRKAISAKYKLEAVRFAEQTSNTAAAKKFSVDRKQIQRWRKMKSTLETVIATGNPQSQRVPGGGRKEVYSELNHKVRQWIFERRAERQCVSRRLIRLEALKIAKVCSGCEEFSASLGWLEKFLRRNNLTLRATTTTCQRPPADYVEKIVNFILFLRKQRQEHLYADSNIFACDETAVWLDPIGKKCIEVRGAKDVTVQTLGHEKVHITVMLCARASGGKCKPFVLLPRKRPVPAIVQKFSGKLLLVWAGKVWMDNSLTQEFLRRVLGPLSFGKRLLVWDSFRCHISNETKAVLSELKIHQAIVPGGCTKYVQPPDVSWNQPFKAAITRFHEDWMQSGTKELTAGGNPRPPPMEIYLQWVSDAWDILSSDLIKESFKACGITNSIDGSEDSLVHCFKSHGPIPEGLEVLKAKSSLQDICEPAAIPEEEHDEQEEQPMEIEEVTPAAGSTLPIMEDEDSL
jgi:hypothetical protein